MWGWKNQDKEEESVLTSMKCLCDSRDQLLLWAKLFKQPVGAGFLYIFLFNYFCGDGWGVGVGESFLISCVLVELSAYSSVTPGYWAFVK